MVKIGILGTTTWGTTLGLIASWRSIDVSQWARTDHEAREITSKGFNPRLPDVKLPENFNVTSDPYEAFASADLIIIASTSESFRENVRRVASYFNRESLLVTATKGLELDSCLRMSQILQEECSQGSQDLICALSGPNLASEILEGKPSTSVIASQSQSSAIKAQSIIGFEGFRIYTSDDITGVELGGALKNIIALAAGICDGRKLGDNAKAAITTRGLAEMSRLAQAAGGRASTIAGLAGIGDLIATCSSSLSRNHIVGERLASGESLQSIRGNMQNVAEGIDTTKAALVLAKRLGVDVPIIRAVHQVLFGSLHVDEAISALLERAPGME